MYSVFTEASATISTIPIVLDQANQLAGKGAIVLFGLAAIAMLICTFVTKDKGMLYGVLVFLVLAVGAGVVLLGQPIQAASGETEKEVKAQYGITYELKNKIDKADFSNTDTQKTIPISNVTLITGESYPNGALVSRDGEVAVYVFEKNSEEPIALELTTGTLFPQP